MDGVTCVGAKKCLKRIVWKKEGEYRTNDCRPRDHAQEAFDRTGSTRAANFGTWNPLKKCYLFFSSLFMGTTIICSDYLPLTFKYQQECLSL